MAAFMLVPAGARAQWAGTSSELMGTMRAVLNEDWMQIPVMRMESDDMLEFSFDWMSHRYTRFTYRITHCDAYWKPSNLIESDWLDGFNDQPIDDYENSLNTTFEYTHYRLSIPNEEVSLKLSGNYMLQIMLDDEQVAFFRFAVTEQAAGIGASVSGNTDIDTNLSHQQMELTVTYPGLRVTDPNRELVTAVMQNRNMAGAVYPTRPQHVQGSSITFSHDRDLIFDAGSEYRRFEITDMYDYQMNVDKVTFHDPYFHATLLEGQRHHAYTYDEDHNGRYLVRCSGSGDSDTEADYLFMHFSLRSEPMRGGKLYLDGDFTHGELTKRWEMEYNQLTGTYQQTALLKMGSYDYRYVWVPDGEKSGQTGPTEGNCHETENEYQVFVYYRPRGSRYDRLVAVSTLMSK